MPPMRILSERLAFWFLRLNGILTIPNFIVHPEGLLPESCLQRPDSRRATMEDSSCSRWKWSANFDWCAALKCATVSFG